MFACVYWILNPFKVSIHISSTIKTRVRKKSSVYCIAFRLPLPLRNFCLLHEIQTTSLWKTSVYIYVYCMNSDNLRLKDLSTCCFYIEEVISLYIHFLLCQISRQPNSLLHGFQFNSLLNCWAREGAELCPFSIFKSESYLPFPQKHEQSYLPLHIFGMLEWLPLKQEMPLDLKAWIDYKEWFLDNVLPTMQFVLLQLVF